MSDTTTPASGWRRMSNKVNTVLKTSIRANEYPNDTLLTCSEVPDLHQGIQSITDFRLGANGTEQYLVSWHSHSNEIKPTWHNEKTIDAICKDALPKFWLKNIISDDVATTGISNSDMLSSAKSIFTKKLKYWVSLPLPKKIEDDGKERSQTAVTLTPSKKRPRLADDDLNEMSFFGSEKKQQKLSAKTNEIHVLKKDANQASLVINKELAAYNYLSEFSSLLHPDEIFDLIDVPQHEIGEVINSNKNIEDNIQQNSYWVKWVYVSNETAETLGLKDKDLQRHFGPSSAAVCDNQKFQLYRKKHCPAIIRELPMRKKLRSPRSDSDNSDSSTVPPSESEGFDSAEYRILNDHFNDVACQTTIELDPFACYYCQSRKGEEGRLSSLRQRRNDCKNKSCCEKKEESQKSDKGKAVETKNSGTDGKGEEEDDDLVAIEYEVEKILNCRKVEGTNVDEYYIRWKGFTSHYDTWEPLENLSSCDKALVTFYINRVGERKLVETELQKLTSSGNFSAAKKLVMPPLPPIPEILMEKLSKVAPVSDEEIQMAYKVSKTIRKNARWSKKKLRKMLLDLIGESGSQGASWSAAAAHDELPVIRHQLLMLESERRKELILVDLKEWEKKLNNIARGRPEIVVENTVDLAGPPSDFKYINDNVLGEGVTFPDDPLEGCDCDSCVKDKSQCCPGKHNKVLAYNSYKRLRVYPGYPIYECNKRCKCGPECANRVVQDGTMSLLGTKLCIFRTKNERGWGVKTLKRIKRGTFVCLYAGEIITSEEAESRGKIYENQLGASYLFDLDYYDAGDDDSCPYTIDATQMGNISHFINHSCEPNLCVFNVWADCLDQNLPKLAFFALRDIEKDEELTYDYGTHDDDTGSLPAPLPVMAEPTGEDEDLEENSMLAVLSSPSKNRLKPATSSGARRPCLCGASTCRKVLF